MDDFNDYTKKERKTERKTKTPLVRSKSKNFISACTAYFGKPKRSIYMYDRPKFNFGERLGQAVFDILLLINIIARVSFSYNTRPILDVNLHCICEIGLHLELAFCHAAFYGLFNNIQIISDRLVQKRN